jgi:hypothetical protein
MSNKQKIDLEKLIKQLSVYLTVRQTASVKPDQFKLLLNQLKPQDKEYAIKSKEIPCRLIYQLAKFEGQKILCM